jgi:hypothetical protein
VGGRGWGGGRGGRPRWGWRRATAGGGDGRRQEDGAVSLREGEGGKYPRNAVVGGASCILQLSLQQLQHNAEGWGSH